MAIQARGVKGFLQWLKVSLPNVYREAEKEFNGSAQLQGLGFLGDVLATASEAPATKTFSQTLQDIATIAGQVYLTREQLQAQRQVLDMQLQRAQQGLPPLNIDPSQYGVPRAEVGLSSDTRQLLIYGGIGFGALLLFMGLQPRSRR